MKKYSYSKIVNEVKNEIKKECKKPANIFGIDFFNYHIMDVVKYSKLLARKLNADMEIVELASLLHDISVVKGDKENHHISGMKEAEVILKRLSYPLGKIEEIKHCINAHRSSKLIERKTVEAECVATADAMAHFDEVPQLFESAFIKFNMKPNEAKKWIMEKLERDWKKLTPEGKRLVKNRYNAAKLLLK